MWKQIRIDHNDYIIKKVSMDGHHKVLLSSFVNMWGEEITSASLYRRCKMYDEITLPLLLMVQQLQAQKHLLFDLLKKKDVEITEYKLEGAQLSRRNIETLAFIESHFEQLCTTIKIPDEFPAQPTQLFTQEIQNLYDNVMMKYANCKKLKEAAEQNADAEDSETQGAFSDSSPEKKQKKNPKQEESLSETQTENEDKIQPEQNNTGDEYQKKGEERLIKCRKEAMKKKQLYL